MEPGNKQAIEELSKLEKYKSSQQNAEKKKVIITEVESEIKEAAPPVLLKKETTKESSKPVDSIKPMIIETVKEEKPVKVVESKPIVKEEPKVISVVKEEPKVVSVVKEEPAKKEAEPTKETTTPVVKTFKIEIPKEPPTTAYEFESFWNSCKSDPESFFHYFKMIPPQKYAQIFKSSMNADILSSIISILNNYYLT